MLKLVSVTLGLLLLLTGTIGCFVLAGNHPTGLVFFVPSLAMFLIPVGCSTLAFGLRGPTVMLRSFAALCGWGHTNAAEAGRIISACIGYVYGAGAFVFLASLLTITKVVTFSTPEALVRNIAPTIASLLYTVVLAELVLRPLEHRLA